MIYLDNNATTQPSPAVAQALHVATTTLFANPSSVHRPGQEARHALELARKELATLLGVPPRELVLTSSGTESINLAIRGVLEARTARYENAPPNPKPQGGGHPTQGGRLSTHGGGHPTKGGGLSTQGGGLSSPREGLSSPRHRTPPPTIITTRLEHAAVRDLALHLQQQGRAEVRWLPLDARGIADPAALEPLLDDRTALVSVQWANNETGVIQPVERLAEICRARGVPFHCDAVQWVGKMPMPEALPCDLLTFSTHKFHGPKGVGGLWVRRGVGLVPQTIGTQETDRRGGTESVAAIVAAGVAAREAAAWLADPAARAKVATLRDHFETEIVARTPGSVVNSRDCPRLWNTTNIAFPALEAEAMLMLLSERGLAASAGAACSSGSLDPSPVLLAMGVPEPLAHGSIRFSLSRNTTEAEIDKAIEIVVAAANQLGRSSAASL